MKANSAFALLSTLAIVLLLSGCSGKQGYPESIYGEKIPPAVKACLAEAGDSDPQFYECIVKVTKGSTGGLLCEQAFPSSGGVAMEAKRDSCIFRSGYLSGNSEICSTISQAGFSAYCKAVLDLSPDECVSLNENQTFCLMQTETVDFEGTGSRLSFKCVSPTKTDCLTEVAIQSRTQESCEMIASICDITANLGCRISYDNCYTKLAETSDNSSLCAKLGKPFSGDPVIYSPDKSVSECVIRTFGSPDKLTECMELPEVQRGECITEYAVSTKNETLCGKIGAGIDKAVTLPIKREDYTKPGSNWSVYAIAKTHDDCLTSIASSLGLPEICEDTFYVEKGKFFCLIEVATSKSDSSLCDKITVKEIRDSCYSQFASSR